MLYALTRGGGAAATAVAAILMGGEDVPLSLLRVHEGKDVLPSPVEFPLFYLAVEASQPTPAVIVAHACAREKFISLFQFSRVEAAMGRID